MVNTRYNDVRPVAHANDLVEEITTRGHGKGKGSGRALDRGCGGVAPFVNKVPNDHISVNENPPPYEEVIEKDNDIENVE